MVVQQIVVLAFLAGFVLATGICLWVQRDNIKDLEHYRQIFGELYGFEGFDIKAARNKPTKGRHVAEQQFDPPIPDFLKDREQEVNLDDVFHEWGGR
jgi:hypothetical protein